MLAQAALSPPALERGKEKEREAKTHVFSFARIIDPKENIIDFFNSVSVGMARQFRKREPIVLWR